MFDAYEAVDNIIDEINENYNEACYDEIYEELCERVECGLLSIADAELINEAAYEKYMMEASRMDKEIRSLIHKRDEIFNRVRKETNDPIKKRYLYNKYLEINRMLVNMENKGISTLYRDGKIFIGRKDARRIARGEKSKVDGVSGGKIDADTVKRHEGDKFSPYTDERKPGYYLGLQNSIR